jgi:uncharacterized protein (DUF983 family)
MNRFLTIVSRSLRTRCPVCGEGKIFRDWFRVHPQCKICGARFEREPGFFLGSIYFNYGLTALIVAILFPVLLFGGYAENNTLLMGSLLFMVIFPVLFFPLARSLWLGFDEFVDPRPKR